MIVDDKGIKDSWKEYMEKLMNEENEWDHKISAEVKQGPGDCIRIAEMTTVLKKMKRHKPRLSELVAEIIQATGEIETQWLLNLCNGIVKEDAFQRIGNQVWYHGRQDWGPQVERQRRENRGAVSGEGCLQSCQL